MTGQRNFYEILHVDQKATPEQIRVAFRTLARERHPDRFLGSARQEAELAFQELTEAYNVLSDERSRARYDQSLAAPPPELTTPKEVARAMLAKAVGLLKAGEVARAGEMFVQALAHDAVNPKAHHLYGMYLAEHAGKLEEGLRQIDHAVKLDPLNPRMLFDASRMFASAGMFIRAERLAEAAADLAPGDDAVESWLQQLKSRAEGAR